ncbi:MAG: replication initiation factor domain-containing protein [Burkholderiaceae bacterium]|nr:replication initiation factor domain-containing protein [Burkholderiaceae bacterium]
MKHRGNGGSGFKYAGDLGDGLGLVRWGGDSQRGRVLFSMMGKGCAMVNDWPGLSAWLEEHGARITRVDVAHDDIEGRVASIEWAIEQYRTGGFNAGGRTPRHEVAGDWLNGEAATAGRTLYVGNRASGKLCRVYEKGKQLGDSSSRWTRVEVEWHRQDRVIPFDVLTKPGQYLAGAYPCLRSLSVDQSRVRTVAKGATVSFDKAVENAKLQAGKLVHLMLRVYGGDYSEVVQRLQREGIPTRIEPYSYQVLEAPERLDEDAPGSYAELIGGSTTRPAERAAVVRSGGADSARPIR